MEKFNLPAALKAYREEHKLSIRQMGQKLNKSKSAYSRWENGTTRPTYAEEVWILKTLDIIIDPSLIEVDSLRIEDIPEPPVKWYNSKMMRWVKPVATSFIVLNIIPRMPGFRDGFGGDQAYAEQSPTPALVIIGIISCLIYWIFYPPQSPFKWLKKELKAVNKILRVKIGYR
ncbi:MAG: helix-turn-helix transcriptional regulator [Bacteroidota bacterium]